MVTVTMKLNKRRLLLGRKVKTNLDSIFKDRDITLLTKVRLVKAMVFLVVKFQFSSVQSLSRVRVCVTPWTAAQEAQAGIKIARRTINNLRYADDPPLWHKVKRN